MFEKVKLKKCIMAAGKRLDEKDLLVGTGGNISARSGNNILITASGLCKAMLRQKDISEVSLQGNLIKGARPARDMQMHLSLYCLRPDIKAIVHTHAPIITGFSTSQYTFEQIALPEILFDLGGIAIADYAVATTPGVAEAVKNALTDKPEARAIILLGHGVLTFSDINVMDACYKMEVLEMVAKTILVTKIIGSERVLTGQQISEINAVISSFK